MRVALVRYKSFAHRCPVRSALGEAGCFEMPKRFSRPDNGVHRLSAFEVHSSAMAREWPYRHIRDTMVAISGNLGHRRIDHRESVSFRNRAWLAHERQKRIAVGINHTATENDARSRTITKKLESDPRFGFV